jgi:hypothetical protein
MGFCLLQFFYESAVLEFELSQLYNVRGSIAFGNARKKILFVFIFVFVFVIGIFLFGVLDLLDSSLKSLNFNLMAVFVVRAFLNFFEPHWAKAVISDSGCIMNAVLIKVIDGIEINGRYE